MTTTSVIETLAQRYADIFAKEYDNIETPSQGCSLVPQNIKGNTYSGSNLFYLNLLSKKKGYRIPVFLTFNQAKEEGVAIKKGEKSVPVIYYERKYRHTTTRKAISEEAYNLLTEEQKKDYKDECVIKYFNVFNICQTSFEQDKAEAYAEYLLRFEDNAGAVVKTREAMLFRVDRLIESESIGKKEDLPKRETYRDDGIYYGDIFRLMAEKENAESRLAPQLAASILVTQLGLENDIRRENLEYMKSLTKNPMDAFKAVNEAASLAGRILDRIGINL